jgi:energy-coupling factor transport system permease protein
LASIDSIEAFQYVSRDSVIHRLNPVIKMAIWLALILTTLAVSDLVTMGILSVTCVAYYFLAGLKLREFIRDSKFVLMASFAIFGLYVAAQGIDSLGTGAAMALRTVTLFLPAVVLLRTTTVSKLLHSFRRLLPYKLILIMAIALRFLPYFSKEFLNILSVQRTRGLRLSLRALFSPEALNCIMVPLAVRGLKTASEISMSISSRAYGAHDKRTYLFDAIPASQLHKVRAGIGSHNTLGDG